MIEFILTEKDTTESGYTLKRDFPFDMRIGEEIVLVDFVPYLKVGYISSGMYKLDRREFIEQQMFFIITNISYGYRTKVGFYKSYSIKSIME